MLVVKRWSAYFNCESHIDKLALHVALNMQARGFSLDVFYRNQQNGDKRDLEHTGFLNNLLSGVPLLCTRHLSNSQYMSQL